ncbi:MAG: response regulator [Verrucomicrobiota bacterium]
MNGSPPLVFVVDDQPLIGKYLETLLEEQGLRTRVFQSASDALKAFSLAEEKPELLITDYHMGDDLNGLELIEAFKRTSPAIKSFLYSGTATEEFIQSFGVQPDVFREKPASPEALREVIQKLVRTPPVS